MAKRMPSCEYAETKCDLLVPCSVAKAKKNERTESFIHLDKAAAHVLRASK